MTLRALGTTWRVQAVTFRGLGMTLRALGVTWGLGLQRAFERLYD